MQKSVLSFDELHRILPHRFPFLLIDRVLELKRNPDGENRAGQSIVAIKNVSINEPYFQGHFPHRPVMPGVMIVEIMAQAGAICCHQESKAVGDMALASVKRAKFRAPISPGDQMEIRVVCIRDRSNMVSFEGKVFVAGQLVAEAEFLATANLL